MLNHRKALKYYKHNYLQNSLLLFLSLLTALVVKNSHVLAEIYFVFLKNVQTIKLEWLSISNLDLSEKIGKAVIKLGKFYRSFAKFVLMSSYNCAKSVKVTKIIKQIKFEGVWGKFKL